MTPQPTMDARRLAARFLVVAGGAVLVGSVALAAFALWEWGRLYLVVGVLLGWLARSAFR